MADIWRPIHHIPADEPNDTGLEEAAYVAGWAMSGAAVLGVVMLIWHFNI